MREIIMLFIGLSLIGCSNQVSQTKEELVERQYALEELKNDAIEDHIDEIPEWVTEVRAPDDEGVFAVGIGESFTLSLAIKKARIEAEFNLAKAFAQELSGSERLYSSEKTMTGSRYEGVIEKIVDKVPVVGYKMIEQEVKALRGKYVVFVMMQLPFDEFNAVLKNKKEAVISKDMEAAFKDLERRLDKRMKENNKTGFMDVITDN